MRKFLRSTLYWLARLAGIIGLVTGGKLLVKYALARLNDPYFDAFSYNDLVFSGGVIFLLSLLLLIFADVGRLLARHLDAAKPETTAAAGEPAKTSAPPASPAPLPAPEPEADRESADEKLARLLKQKRE